MLLVITYLHVLLLHINRFTRYVYSFLVYIFIPKTYTIRQNSNLLV